MRSVLALITALLIAETGAIALPASFSGRCAVVDPGFAYYRNRSAESIAQELAANGFSAVSLIITNEANIDNNLVKVLSQKGLAVRMMTLGNGTYSRKGLPEGWEPWKMVLPNSEGPSWYTFLCLNNREYRQWKKKEITDALNKHPFVGVEIAEPYLPNHDGPYNPWYACVCENCKAAFMRMYPEERAIPEFADQTSVRYWQRNARLYRKWVDFRVATVTDFLDDLVNGPGGIRERCPGRVICTWSLADSSVPDGVSKEREWTASDAGDVCVKVRPDVHCFQTDWTDWCKPDLPADYAKGYKPFIDALRERDTKTPIILQTDSGSNKEMRRSGEWLQACEKTAKALGFCQTIAYEYHLGLDMYTRPPELVSAQLAEKTGELILVFDKRLDPKVASDPKSYALSSGEVLSAAWDGNLAKLATKGVKQGGVVRVLRCADDPSVRWHREYSDPNFSPEMSCTIASVD